MDNLASTILRFLESAPASENVRSRIKKRIVQGDLTKEENSESHFCCYFLPLDRHAQKIFIVHHKKAQTWISPGGHIEKDERLIDTLNREISEELGVPSFFITPPLPFFFSITDIKNDPRKCKEHLDIWFLMETDGKDFNVDPSEFWDTKWITFEEAESTITEQTNREAIKLLKTKTLLV